MKMEESQKNRISAFFSPSMILLGFNAVERIGVEAKKFASSRPASSRMKG
jgi:hypothetical protein